MTKLTTLYSLGCGNRLTWSRLKQGYAANIKLKESKLELKESDPTKWRQYLLGVWRRNVKKPGVADLYDSKLRMAEQQCQQWLAQFPDFAAYRF
ncbi:MAG: hypothetical protein IPM39_04400 [Chloroflexi bacterium]|nr:hypothetical protein [Chloroflexota bacterium]